MTGSRTPPTPYTRARRERGSERERALRERVRSIDRRAWTCRLDAKLALLCSSTSGSKTRPLLTALRVRVPAQGVLAPPIDKMNTVRYTRITGGLVGVTVVRRYGCCRGPALQVADVRDRSLLLRVAVHRSEGWRRDRVFLIDRRGRVVGLARAGARDRECAARRP